MANSCELAVFLALMPGKWCSLSLRLAAPSREDVVSSNRVSRPLVVKLAFQRRLHHHAQLRILSSLAPGSGGPFFLLEVWWKVRPDASTNDRSFLLFYSRRQHQKTICDAMRINQDDSTC